MCIIFFRRTPQTSALNFAITPGHKSRGMKFSINVIFYPINRCLMACPHKAKPIVPKLFEKHIWYRNSHLNFSPHSKIQFRGVIPAHNIILHQFYQDKPLIVGKLKNVESETRAMEVCLKVCMIKRCWTLNICHLLYFFVYKNFILFNF